MEGTKGAADQLIIALGSAGAFQAAVDCLRAWLGRDRDRRIDLRWEQNGIERSVTLTGEATNGLAVDYANAIQGSGNDTATLNPRQSRRVFLRVANCAGEVSGAR